MNNAKHTPGPWVGYTNTGEGRHIISEACTQDVIVCEQVHTDADIAIIAAAPAMYEALHGIVLAHETGMKGSAMALRVKIARDALAQAEGRQA